jgi:hypothetical protein
MLPRRLVWELQNVPEVSPRLDQRRGVASDSEAFDHFSSFFHIFPQESLARVGLSTQATFLLRLPLQLFAALITWAFENFSKSQVDETDGPSTAVHALRQIDSRFEESWKEGRGWTTDRTCPDCLVVCHGSKVGTAN